jgi:hypothetical protein
VVVRRAKLETKPSRPLQKKTSKLGRIIHISLDARRYMCVALDSIIFPKASFFARACKGDLEFAYVYPGEFGCTS